MFSGYCANSGTNNLMGPTRIRAFRNTADGPVFVYECVCGATGISDAATGKANHASQATGERAAA